MKMGKLRQYELVRSDFLEELGRPIPIFREKGIVIEEDTPMEYAAKAFVNTKSGYLVFHHRKNEAARLPGGKRTNEERAPIKTLIRELNEELEFVGDSVGIILEYTVVQAADVIYNTTLFTVLCEEAFPKEQDTHDTVFVPTDELVVSSSYIKEEILEPRYHKLYKKSEFLDSTIFKRELAHVKRMMQKLDGPELDDLVCTIDLSELTQDQLWIKMEMTDDASFSLRKEAEIEILPVVDGEIKSGQCVFFQHHKDNPHFHECTNPLHAANPSCGYKRSSSYLCKNAVYI
jgi:hypothetical protein